MIRLALIILFVIAAFNTATTVLLWRSNVARVQQINDERAANVRRSCEDVNRRHDAAVHQLRVLVESTPLGTRKRRAEQNIEGTIALLEAIVPRRDCAALVERQVNTK